MKDDETFGQFLSRLYCSHTTFEELALLYYVSVKKVEEPSKEVDGDGLYYEEMKSRR